MPNAAQPYQGHLANTQSTHGPAAEASAARVILLLRQTYCEGSIKEVTTDDVSWFEQLQGSEFNLATDDVPESMQGIMQFIAFIKKPSNHFDNENTRQILKFIVQLAKLGTDHWTKNRYYSEQEGKEIIIDSSLGESLNLVCLALLDQSAYKVAKDSSKEQDTYHRIDSLFQCLLGQPARLCSGGRQHEILFLLNGIYCPRNRKGQLEAPLRLIEDYDSFLHDSASQQLAEQLSEAYSSPEMVFDFVRPWVLLLDSDADELPYEVWLEKQGELLRDFLTRQSVSFGLSPEFIRDKIDNFIQALVYLEAPNTLHPAIASLKQLSSQLAKQSQREDANSASGHSTLIAKKQAALSRAKECIARLKNFDEALEIIQGLSRAVDVADEVSQYLKLSLVIDEAGVQLKASCDELADLLSHYFESFRTDKTDDRHFTLPEEFDEKTQAFHQVERMYKQETHLDFIKNFFAILSTDVSRLDQLLDELNPFIRQLTLTDEKLETWLEQNRADDGAIEISPYEINLILINAWLQPPAQWSDLFTRALNRVVSWLLESDSKQGLLGAVRKNYSSEMLANILFLVLIKQSTHLTTQEKEEIFNNIQCSVDERFQDRSRVIKTNSLLLKSMDCHSEALRTKILTAVKDNLSALIHSGHELRDLLACDKLTEAHRTEILTVVIDNLNALIQSGYQLLLNCDKLTEAHRTKILTAVKDNLSASIHSGHALRDVLACDKLTDAHITEILTAVKDNSSISIQNELELWQLLNCNKLTDAHITEILTAVKGNAGIERGWDLLNVLMWKQLNDEHRMYICEIVSEECLQSCYAYSDYNKKVLPFLIATRGISDKERAADLPRVKQTAMFEKIADIYLTQLKAGRKLTDAQKQLCLKIKPILRERFLKNASTDELNSALKPETPLGQIFATHRNMLFLHRFSFFNFKTCSVKMIENKKSEIEINRMAER